MVERQGMLVWVIARGEHAEWGIGYYVFLHDDAVFVADGDHGGIEGSRSIINRWLRGKRRLLGKPKRKIVDVYRYEDGAEYAERYRL